MKKKWFTILGAAVVVLLVLCCMARVDLGVRQVQEESLPYAVPLVMVDGKLYQGYGPGEEPDSQPEGTLRKIPENEIPRENEQANFGTDAMPYWRVDGEILVYVNENYYLLKETDIQEFSYER